MRGESVVVTSRIGGRLSGIFAELPPLFFSSPNLSSFLPTHPHDDSRMTSYPYTVEYVAQISSHSWWIFY